MKRFVKKTATFIVLCSAVAMIPPVMAQDDDKDPPIIVDGVLIRPEKQIPLILDNSFGQLARFEGEFCPFVAGLPEDYGIAVLKMVRENAVSLGLEAPEDDCKPNALIIFTPKIDKYMADLRKKRGSWFDSLTPRNRRLLTKQERPFYAWHDTTFVTSGGAIDFKQRGFGFNGIPLAGGLNTSNSLNTAWGGPYNANGGRIEQSTSVGILNAFVVMDLLETDSMTLRQLADFATLNLLINFDDRAREQFPQNSILNLFDVDDPEDLEQGMSEVDRLTAKGLYTLTKNSVDAWKQSRRIARYVRKNLGKNAPADDIEQIQSEPISQPGVEPDKL